MVKQPTPSEQSIVKFIETTAQISVFHCCISAPNFTHTMKSFQLRRKIENNYDPEKEAIMKEFIEQALDKKLGNDFFGALKSGVILCEYESVE